MEKSKRKKNSSKNKLFLNLKLKIIKSINLLKKNNDFIQIRKINDWLKQKSFFLKPIKFETSIRTPVLCIVQ